MGRYRFRLKIGSAAYVLVHPRWDGENTAIVTEQGENEMYYREKLNAKLIFQRDDFDLIHNAAFDTEFTVSLEEFTGSFWIPINIARFWKTDCEIDEDNNTIEVSPQTFDAYEKILQGMGKEFDLIELAPAKVSVNYLKQAVIQVYLPGSSFIANFTDGAFWEEQCLPFNTTAAPGMAGSSTNHLAMLNDYGFATGTGFSTPDDGFQNYARVVIPGSLNVSGIYRAHSYNADGLPILTTNENTSYIREDGVYAIVNNGLLSPTQTQQFIRRVSDGVNMYATPVVASPNSPFGQPPHSTPNATFTSLTTSATCEAYLFMPYARILTTLEEVNATATVPIPDTDPFPHGSYTHALPLDTLNFEYSASSSTAPTRWPKVSEDAIYDSGKYFTKPTSTETLMPVSSTTWTGASAWFWLDTDLRDLQIAASKAIKLEDCYKLSDVIGKLLSAIGSTAEHRDNSTFSNFLYAASNTIRGSRRVPVITPKSNVLIGEYDQPAQKAPIRFREVLDLLRDFYNSYWHVAGRNFIVEHRHYYDNGKSYATPGIGIDLTESLEPRTGKPWSYRTSKYNYSKDKLPERIEVKWMDNVSKPFEGYPIQVKSNYVNLGNIERKNLSRFTSDIDFFNVSANEISKEGFVVFECVEDGAELNVPFLEVTVGTDETYKLQNGYMAFIYAHPQYWKHGLPANSVNLNTVDIAATTTIRTKKQELEIAVGSTVDPYLLVTSTIGDAKIESIERNLSSSSLKIQLKHDTE